MHGKLQQCQGDCDEDSHCAPGLECFQRHGTEQVPACFASIGEVLTHTQMLTLTRTPTPTPTLIRTLTHIPPITLIRTLTHNPHLTLILTLQVPGCLAGGDGDKIGEDYCHVPGEGEVQAQYLPHLQPTLAHPTPP